MTAKAHPFLAWKLDMEALGYSPFCPGTGLFLAHKYSKYWYLLLIYLGICWTDRPCFIHSFNIYIECLPYTENWGRSWVCSGEQNRHKPLLTKCFKCILILIAHGNNKESIKNVGAYAPPQEIPIPLEWEGAWVSVFVKATQVLICSKVESWGLAGS